MVNQNTQALSRHRRPSGDQPEGGRQIHGARWLDPRKEPRHRPQAHDRSILARGELEEERSGLDPHPHLQPGSWRGADHGGARQHPRQTVRPDQARLVHALLEPLAGLPETKEISPQLSGGESNGSRERGTTTTQQLLGPDPWGAPPVTLTQA